MRNDISEQQLTRYRENFLQYGDSPQGTYQNDRTTQYLRFQRLLRNLQLKGDGFSIHDVGAGVADLHHYLNEQGVQHTYSGTEIVPEMVQSASRRVPGIQLTTDDFLAESNEPNADFVVLSGTLNLCCDSDGIVWSDYCLRVLVKMFKSARCGIAANFLTNRNTFSAANLHYAAPGLMLDFCLDSMSRFVTIDHAYPLFEFTLTVLKPEYVQSMYSDPALAKYFRASRQPAD